MDGLGQGFRSGRWGDAAELLDAAALKHVDLGYASGPQVHGLWTAVSGVVVSDERACVDAVIAWPKYEAVMEAVRAVYSLVGQDQPRGREDDHAAGLRTNPPSRSDTTDKPDLACENHSCAATPARGHAERDNKQRQKTPHEADRNRPCQFDVAVRSRRQRVDFVC